MFSLSICTLNQVLPTEYVMQQLWRLYKCIGKDSNILQRKCIILNDTDNPRINSITSQKLPLSQLDVACLKLCNCPSWGFQSSATRSSDSVRWPSMNAAAWVGVFSPLAVSRLGRAAHIPPRSMIHSLLQQIPSDGLSSVFCASIW